jgi:TonB family protein
MSRFISVFIHVVLLALLIVGFKTTHLVARQRYNEQLVFTAPVQPIHLPIPKVRPVAMSKLVSSERPAARLALTVPSTLHTSRVDEQPRMVALSVPLALDLPLTPMRVSEAPQAIVGSFSSPAAGIVSSHEGASAGNGRGVAVAGFGNGTTAGNGSGHGEVKLAEFDRQSAPAVIPVAAHESIQPPVVKSEANPIYTAAAHEAHISGVVVLRIRFTAEGSVKVLGVLQGLGYGLDESAIRTAESITFSPAMQGGQPVAFDTTVRITFQLGG